MSQVALTLPGLATPTWQVRGKNDPAACALADRHYSRRRPGSGQVGPPGRKLVLVSPCERAVWLTHWPDRALAMDGLDCWRCSIFRNEAPAELRSSDLIRAAMDLTASLWPGRPTTTPGWVTWVDPAKVASPNSGYCFKQAGWTLDRAWSHQRLIRLRAPIPPTAQGRPLGGVEVRHAGLLGVTITDQDPRVWDPPTWSCPDNRVLLFRVLRDRGPELARALRLTPYARAELDAADLDGAGLDELERVRRVFVRLNMTVGKTLRRSSGFAAAFNTNGADHAHKFASLVDHLDAAATRLRRVIIEDRPALEVIAKYGAANAVIYCDPPYLEATRSALAKRRGADYQVEYASEAEHRELAAALHATPAAVLVSGYPSALYEDLYAGWWRLERVVDKPSSLTSGGRAARGVEVVWSNRPLREQLQLDRLAVPIVEGAPPAVTLPVSAPNHIGPPTPPTEPTQPTQPQPDRGSVGSVGFVDRNRTGHGQPAKGGAR